MAGPRNIRELIINRPSYSRLSSYRPQLATKAAVIQLPTPGGNKHRYLSRLRREERGQGRRYRERERYAESDRSGSSSRSRSRSRERSNRNIVRKRRINDSEIIHPDFTDNTSFEHIFDCFVLSVFIVYFVDV